MVIIFILYKYYINRVIFLNSISYRKSNKIIKLFLIFFYIEYKNKWSVFI